MVGFYSLAPGPGLEALLGICSLYISQNYRYTPVYNYVYHKKLLNENESHFVLVAAQFLLVTINNA